MDRQEQQQQLKTCRNSLAKENARYEQILLSSRDLLQGWENRSKDTIEQIAESDQIQDSQLQDLVRSICYFVLGELARERLRKTIERMTEAVQELETILGED